MNRKEFQKLAVRTESIVENPKLTVRDYHIFEEALNAYINIVEVLDIYKKHIFYDRDVNFINVCEFSRIAKESLYKVHLSSLEEQRAITTLKLGESLDIRTESLPADSRVLHAILGTITEHGELGIAMQKALDTGEFDLVNVCEELGDSDWYKALFYETTGISWENVQAMIIKKLEIRYPEKVFDGKSANERDLKTERALLEELIQEAIEEYSNGLKK